MSQIIAGIYEIEREIGSGGGGVVYLGRHLRLEKPIVLKADKRTLNARPESLRREVDMLKGLSHTYIPQVYDFVQQDGVVYTVMEYIDGESLDKILKSGKRIPQTYIIQWAGQVLQALVYLHSRPPHGILHADIKPANIMLRPNGDICLIDYNIALALKEDGAVKVGHSQGYASPEHYGSDFSSPGKTVSQERIIDDKTDISDTDATQKNTGNASSHVSSSSSGTKGARQVKLDVRSDIYSLGATLYHLLSGQKPRASALEVVPLHPDVCSPAVSAIVKKAMEPDPGKRYQTAEEMLQAFRDLHKKDSRILRHKRRKIAAAAILSAGFLAGGASAFTGLKQMESRQNALVLAEYSQGELANGNISEAVRLALEALPKENSIFEAPVTPQAQKALADALGVYDLADGFKSMDSVELPSAPFQTAISPEGTYFAAVCEGSAIVFSCETGEQLVQLPIGTSAMSELCFVGENQVLYAGKDGVSLYDLAQRKTLWKGRQATTLAVSADGRVAAAVNRAEDHAVIYRMEDGTVVGECSFEGKKMNSAYNDIFANPNDDLFALSGDGRFLAVSFSDGAVTIFDLEDLEGTMILYEESEFIRFTGGFCGNYFAYTTEKTGQSLFGLVDTSEAYYIGGYEAKEPFSVLANEEGIFLSNENLLAKFQLDTMEEIELAYTEDVDITGFSVSDGYVVTATEDFGYTFFDSGANPISGGFGTENWDFVEMAGEYAILANRNAPSVRMMKLESHEEASVMSYDARYPHDEARISADGNTVMFFDYSRFRICDMDGTIICEQEIPDSDKIYDQQFEKLENGSRLKVIWYDGTIRYYRAADGTVISEEKGEEPSMDLYEEFFTDRYRIASSLHSAPAAYDLESGELVKTLEEESYLTYVTQVGDQIVTEYVTADGERYGLLLDEELQTIAYLPGLCDIHDGKAIFDFESGNLRQSRLYSLQELKDLGESYK